MVRKTKAETEQTYHALLDAAIALFTRQGVARTTLNEIAQEAQGVGQDVLVGGIGQGDLLVRRRVELVAAEQDPLGA
ncbi:MAG: TetR family transcriptional regulator, partial [Granulosicoccaceae bacterium]